MDLAEKTDSEEIPNEMDIPEELSRRQDRLDAIAQAKAKIEERAAQRYAEEQKEYDEKLLNVLQKLKLPEKILVAVTLSHRHRVPVKKIRSI